MTAGSRIPSASDLDPDTLAAAIDAPCHHIRLASAGCLSYYEDSDVEGRPLVLLHSINAAPSAMEMKPLFEHYRSRRPVYAPDLPGYGRSERNDIPYSPEMYADVLREFLAEVSVASEALAAMLARLAPAEPKDDLVDPDEVPERRDEAGRVLLVIPRLPSRWR